MKLGTKLNAGLQREKKSQQITKRLTYRPTKNPGK
jgi:hypothetical protein